MICHYEQEDRSIGKEGGAFFGFHGRRAVFILPLDVSVKLAHAFDIIQDKTGTPLGMVQYTIGGHIYGEEDLAACCFFFCFQHQPIDHGDHLFLY